MQKGGDETAGAAFAFGSCYMNSSELSSLVGVLIYQLFPIHFLYSLCWMEVENAGGRQTLYPNIAIHSFIPSSRGRPFTLGLGWGRVVGGFDKASALSENVQRISLSDWSSWMASWRLRLSFCGLDGVGEVVELVDVMLIVLGVSVPGVLVRDREGTSVGLRWDIINLERLEVRGV